MLRYNMHVNLSVPTALFVHRIVINACYFVALVEKYKNVTSPNETANSKSPSSNPLDSLDCKFKLF